MKNVLKAKELMKDPICADCNKLLTGDDEVILFQDNQHHDLKDGYYCEKCAKKYDENGQKIKQSIIDEIWEAKKEGYSIDIFPDGSTYNYIGTNQHNETMILTFRQDKYRNDFPKRKMDIESAIRKELNRIYGDQIQSFDIFE